MIRFYISLFLISLLFYAPLAVQAGTLKGKVTDRQTGEALAGCAVYIDQSTIGTATDQEGRFVLPYNGALPVQLVFRSVGYELKAVQILPGSPEEMNIALAAQHEELDEVKVLAPTPDGWERYGKDFLDNFIGYSDWSASCELVNKKDLVFRYDRDNMVLTVHAPVPLVIRHKQLGYTIYYDLNDFTLDYKAHTVFYSGYVRYEPLVYKNQKRREKVDQHRKEAFHGSLNHFVRALYSNQLTEEGFEVRRLLRVKNTDYGRIVPQWTDTMLLRDAASLTLLTEDMMQQPGVDSARVVQALAALLGWIKKDSGDRMVEIPLPLKDSLKRTPYHYHFEKTGTPYQAIVRFFNHDRRTPADSARWKQMSAVKINNRPVTVADLPETAYDMLYTALMPSDTFRRKDDNKLFIDFDGYLHVTYTKELEERPYLRRLSTFSGPEPKPDVQRSIITIRNPSGRVQAFRNGNFSPVYDLFLEGYWFYEKLDKQLPLDYEP